MIPNIENGMELAKVRRILNQAIERLNELEKVSGSYDDLENRPAIDGVTLTSKTTFQEFRIPISSLESYEELQKQILTTAEETAERTATESLKRKLDADFTTLKAQRRNNKRKITCRKVNVSCGVSYAMRGIGVIILKTG